MHPEKKHIDLHIHSNYSDGALSPEALVSLARQRGIAAIAITDHDTMAGIPEAYDVGRKQNVELIPGVEISALHNGTSMHILGYGLDHEEEGLQRGLGVLQDARRTRNQGIITKLNTLGIHISLGELSRPNGGQIGRPHIARLLVKKRVVKTVNQAFALYLRNKGSAFVDSYKFPAEEAIGMIRSAGGLAFLAHPASLDPSLALLPALFRDLKEMGLSGFELYYPKHSATTWRTLKKMGDEAGLLFCGGSDFHGDMRRDTPLGGNSKFNQVPYNVWLVMQDALKIVKNERLPSANSPSRS